MKVYVLLVNPSPECVAVPWQVEGVYRNEQDAVQAGVNYCGKKQFIQDLYADFLADDPSTSFAEYLQLDDDFMYIEEHEVKGE